MSDLAPLIALIPLQTYVVLFISLMSNNPFLLISKPERVFDPPLPQFDPLGSTLILTSVLSPFAPFVPFAPSIPFEPLKPLVPLHM